MNRLWLEVPEALSSANSFQAWKRSHSPPVMVLPSFSRKRCCPFWALQADTHQPSSTHYQFLLCTTVDFNTNVECFSCFWLNSERIGSCLFCLVFILLKMWLVYIFTKTFVWLPFFLKTSHKAITQTLWELSYHFVLSILKSFNLKC